LRGVGDGRQRRAGVGAHVDVDPGGGDVAARHVEHARGVVDGRHAGACPGELHGQVSRPAAGVEDTRARDVAEHSPEDGVHVVVPVAVASAPIC
jgi:hypothetical protein